MISDRHVLTAAHCVKEKNFSLYELSLGAMNTNAFKEGKILGEIEEIIRHPDFNWEGASDNNIAIIKLKNSVKFEGNENPICLPDFDETDNLFVYGLGVQDTNGFMSTGNMELREVFLNRSIDSCQSPNLICSEFSDGFTRNGTAAGDSGSPYSSRKNGRVYQVGVHSSWAAPAGYVGYLEEMIPRSIGVKVYHHLEWIRNNTHDGVFCEAEHHPFAKPDNNTGEVVGSNNQTCGQLKPGQSMDKPGRKPWELFVEIESEAGYTTSTPGVLISDRHVLIGAKDLQYENGGRVKRVSSFQVSEENGIFYRSDFNSFEVKADSLSIIRLPHQLTASFAVFELETPLDVKTDSSPFAAICLLDASMTFSEADKVLEMNTFEGVSKKVVTVDYAYCTYLSHTYINEGSQGGSREGGAVTQETSQETEDDTVTQETSICTERVASYLHDYLTATKGNRTYIAGFFNPRPWNQRFDRFQAWMSVSLATPMLQSLMEGVQILPSRGRSDAICQK